MLNYFFIILLLSQSALTLGQDVCRREVKKWVKHTFTQMNHPVAPEGYSKMRDCHKYPVFKRKNKDTVSFFHLFQIDTVAFRDNEKIEILNKPYTYTYPRKILGDGRILLVSLRYDEFVIRKDTLIMRENLEMINPRNYNRTLSNFFRWAEKNSDNVSDTSDLVSEIKIRYKVIYYKGMFNEMKFKRIPESMNYRNERVSLMMNWEQNGMQCFEIKLESIPRENYVFNEKFDFLEYENCNIKDKRFEK